MHFRVRHSAARLLGVLVVASLSAALPFSASAATKRRAVSDSPQVHAFPISPTSYPGMQITSAIESGPNYKARVKLTTYVIRGKGKHRHRHKRVRYVTRTLHATREWLVVSGPLQSELLAASPAGRVHPLVTNLLPTTTAPAGQADPYPSYGSVQADGFIWLIDYTASPATLYAVSSKGQMTEVATLTGDLTSITAGPSNTIEVADNSGHLDRCAITTRPSAVCQALTVPANFAGGQIDALGASRSRVWFTDDAGELGSFNPANNRFGGPFGDISQSGQEAGQASADPGTIVLSTGGGLYIAGGQDSNPLFQNNLIRLINAGQGTTLRSYSSGLTNVVAMTATSDGNLWFLDSTNPATGAGRVGSLDTSTGVIHEFKLPKGFRLPATGAAIAAGPYGSGTVYFTLETASQQGSAIGVVTGTELVGP